MYVFAYTYALPFGVLSFFFKGAELAKHLIGTLLLTAEQMAERSSAAKSVSRESGGMDGSMMILVVILAIALGYYFTMN